MTVSVVSASTFVRVSDHAKQISVQSINSSNIATGFELLTDGTERAFIRAAGGKIRHFVIDDQRTAAFCINGDGAVVGLYGDASFHGFVRSPHGTVTTFDAAGAGNQDNQGTVPTAINANGAIAGYFIDDANAWHGFFRRRNGTITPFDVAGNTLPRGINKDGTVVGQYYTNTHHGFLRTSSGQILTIDPSGSVDTDLTGINDQGEIGGDFSDGKTRHGFVRAADGTFKDFTVSGSTWVSGINNSGGVTGSWVDKDGVVHGFVRNADGGIAQLDPPKTIFSAPRAISDGGVVAGDFETKRKNLGFLWFP